MHTSRKLFCDVINICIRRCQCAYNILQETEVNVQYVTSCETMPSSDSRGHKTLSALTTSKESKAYTKNVVHCKLHNLIDPAGLGPMFFFRRNLRVYKIPINLYLFLPLNNRFLF